MLRIEFRDAAKRYRLEWVLRHINLTLEGTRRYAITGPNGSGKSTLMRMISGHLSPSEGKINFFLDDQPLPVDAVFRHLSYGAPYIELIEEFTLEEAVRFHQQFKTLRQNLSTEGLIDLLAFPRARYKPIRYFSSGMKQRLKLALSIATESPLLLLDEPTTNLDRQGVQWYLDLIERFGNDRLVVVASNVEEDYRFCDEMINSMDFKSRKKRSK